ncbi:MAG TPA: hypothetical protein VN679_13580 [Candidatus Acidoferrales bacterium]|nr:hypothetical protein [Candidatus Acidoferrales bacterium]
MNELLDGGTPHRHLQKALFRFESPVLHCGRLATRGKLTANDNRPVAAISIMKLSRVALLIVPQDLSMFYSKSKLHLEQLH